MAQPPFEEGAHIAMPGCRQRFEPQHVRAQLRTRRPGQAMTPIAHFDLGELARIAQRGKGAIGGDRAKNERSEERRVGKECVSTCRSRGSPNNKKKKKER